jgi:hypothetical protein
MNKEFYLDCGEYRIPLKPVSYWARGPFSEGIRNEFGYVQSLWDNFKNDYNVQSKYKATPTRYDDLMYKHLVYDTQPNLNVFYTTVGHPEGDVPAHVQKLFQTMERANVCAPISGLDYRIRVV